jgi:tetratricopeptide (TPR) repeat protein/glutathione synthase/RimK-type ligase-like ATP-grasp enzyme
VTKIADDDDLTSRVRAVALHQGGKISEAAELYEILLRAEPANPDLWGLLSIAQLRLGRDKVALASWRKCLSIETTVPLRLRNIANFVLAMQQKDKIQAQPMDFLDSLDIPEWPVDLPLDRNNQSIIVALARCLTDFGRNEAALRLLDSVLSGLSGDPEFLATVAPIMIAAGKPEKILELLRPLTSSDHRGNGTLLIAQAAAAGAAQRREEAETVSRRAREAVPVFLSAKMPNQHSLLGVLNMAPKFIKEAHSPARLHFSENVPATLFAKMNDEFRFLSIFPQAESAKEALTALPRPQLIISNWVNPEILSRADTLEFIADYADSFDLPVINHPRRACLTTRQRNAERLAGIPDVVVPRIMRILNEPEKRQLLIRVVSEELGFPVIIRSPFTQEGAETVKIATPTELAAYLSTVEDPQLYAIEYIHNPVPEGAYRKIRAAVIGGELIMLHVRFGALWNVHRAKDDKQRHNLMAFDTKGTALAFAQKILRRPEEALGKPVMAALHEIRARTPLDFFGIDFDLLPDGRILFFEANAAMNFSIQEKEDLPEIILAVRSAFRRLFENPPLPTSSKQPF